MTVELIKTNLTRSGVHIARFRQKDISKSIIFAVLIVISALVCSSATAQVAEYKPHKVDVVIKKSALRVGKSSAWLNVAANNEIAAKFKYKPGIALKVFGERKYVQNSKLQITPEGVRTMEFTVDGGREKSTGVRFDWSGRTLEFQDGSSQPMPDHEIYDLLGWHVSLMLTPPESLAGKTISIIEESTVSTYVYGPVVMDTVKIFDKKTSAYRIRLQHQEKEDEAYVIWLSPEYNNLPVKMKRYKYKTSANIITKKLEWLK